MRIGTVVLLLTLLFRPLVSAAEYPAPVDGDVTLREFRFASGEMLPELRIHYRTLGYSQAGRPGNIVRNAVLSSCTAPAAKAAALVRKGGAGDIFAAELFGQRPASRSTRPATSSSCPTTSATVPDPPSPAMAGTRSSPATVIATSSWPSTAL